MEIEVREKFNKSGMYIGNEIYVDGTNIEKLDYNARLDILNQIVLKITDKHNWFESFVTGICTQFGKLIESEALIDIYKVEL